MVIWWADDLTLQENHVPLAMNIWLLGGKNKTDGVICLQHHDLQFRLIDRDVISNGIADMILHHSKHIFYIRKK